MPWGAVPGGGRVRVWGGWCFSTPPGGDGPRRIQRRIGWVVQAGAQHPPWGTPQHKAPPSSGVVSMKPVSGLSGTAWGDTPSPLRFLPHFGPDSRVCLVLPTALGALHPTPGAKEPCGRPPGANTTVTRRPPAALLYVVGTCPLLAVVPAAGPFGAEHSVQGCLAPARYTARAVDTSQPRRPRLTPHSLNPGATSPPGFSPVPSHTSVGGGGVYCVVQILSECEESCF